ncbi:MAG: efflux RND transporter periplasmic adaptor subunit [Planctomycetes bacterium]|nr:efflux RND transporter periplasmic adaptor subunit [Planctomycetota bacterium]
MRKKTVVFLAVAVVIGGAITWQALKPPEPTKVLTAQAEVLDELRSIVSATGEIRAKEFVDIQAEVSGIIVEVDVVEGQNVAKGDILLRLEDLPFRADVNAATAQLKATEADAKNAEVGVATAEANLAAEKTALAGLKVELEQARTTRDRSDSSLTRKKELFQQHLIGSEEFEIAAADARIAQQTFELRQARIEQGEANIHAAETRVSAAASVLDGQLQRIEAARASLDRAKDMLDKTVLRAPIAGLITKLNVEKGERAVPGIQSNPIATLMTIADMSVIEAEISVAEADIVMVQLGAPAVVEVDAMRDVEIRGEVTEVGQSPIQDAATSGAGQEGKDFKVVVRLDAPPKALRPGFTATADITTATRQNVLVIPLQAQTAREVELDAEKRYVPPPEPIDDSLVTPVAAADRRKLEEVEGVFVMLDGRARFRPVKLGIIGDMDVEVLDGLAAGDTVVIGPIKALRTLREWDRVAIDEKRQRESVIRLGKKSR